MVEEKYILEIAPQVARDLREIEFYKRSHDTYPGNVEKLLATLRTEMRRLGQSPLTAPSMRNKTIVPNNYRYSPISDYLIIFEIVGNRVKIYRVLSGKMDYLNILGLI